MGACTSHDARLAATRPPRDRHRPGEFDEDYIAYLAGVTAKAAEHDVRVYVDPHQATEV